MFQDIHFVKNSFFKKSENITGAIFTLNYKYATFFIYALALLVLGRYLYVSDFIYCDNMHNAISSKEMINGFCFHQGIFTISFTKKVRYKCPSRESAHDNYFIKIRERRCIRVFLLYRRTKKRPKITISILFFLGLSFSFLELASFFLSSFGRNLKMATWLDCWRQQMTPRGKHLTYGLNSPFFAGST